MYVYYLSVPRDTGQAADLVTRVLDDVICPSCGLQGDRSDRGVIEVMMMSNEIGDGVSEIGKAA